MKKACHYGFLIQLKIRKDDCNTERMNDIRFTGFTFLILMCLTGHFIGLFDHGNICRRMIFLHAFYKLLIKNLRACKIMHGFHRRICLPDRLSFFFFLLYLNVLFFRIFCLCH